MKHGNWKKKLTKNVTNNQIDELYNYCIKNGAEGGKLLGSGAGGFFLFVCKNSEGKKKLAKSLKNSILVNFKTEKIGSKIIFKNKDYYDTI
jgi:D-glycero-alpha-D-manno-heptose-7-phosphate kinase